MRVIYLACAWALRVMAAASVIMFIAGVSMRLSIVKGLMLLVLGAGFLLTSFVFKSTASGYYDAADEIRYGLDHPESNVPEDYEPNTKSMRKSICLAMKSPLSLVFAYGFIGLMLWGCTALLIGLSGVFSLLNPDPGPWVTFEPLMFALSFVTLAMAVPLTYLSIMYYRDIPAARHFRAQILAVLDDTETSSKQ